jgi:hypothetical protein
MNKFDLISIIIIIFSISVLFLLKFKKIINNNNIDSQINQILKDNKESFIVADANEFRIYDQLKNNTKNNDDNFDKDAFKNPNPNMTLNYDKKEPSSNIMVVNGEPEKINETKNEKSFVTSNEFGWDAPFPIVGCSNSSVDNRYKSGPHRLLPYEISCGYSNKITAENFYKTHFMARPAKLEDYIVRGSNYMEYSNYIHPTKSNIRILSQNTKGLPPENTKYRNIPSGTNYAFHNTPAMRMA